MSLSKRIRFEVFKRDSFTCQYCGAKAPDVVLHADHVIARANGGTDDLINLITACQPCNAGKSDVPLSDTSVVVKQRAQLEALQERREQIEMMVRWHRSLIEIDAETLERLTQFWCDLADWWYLDDDQKLIVKRLVKKYGAEEVLTAMRIAADTYIKWMPLRHPSGDILGQTPTIESTPEAFEKLPAICAIRKGEKKEPWLKEFFYVRGILRNRVAEGQINSWPADWRADEILRKTFEVGGDAAEIKAMAKGATSWTRWQRDLTDYITDLEARR